MALAMLLSTVAHHGTTCNDLTMPSPTLLLLPGLLCDATVWQRQADHIGKSINIIVPDLTHASTPQEMVTAALALAPPSFLLAGHSMGGWVALEIMKSAPERVEKLCLINTTAKPDSTEKSLARREMIALTQQGAFDTVVERLANGFVYQKNLLPRVKTMLRHNQDAFISQETAMLLRGDCIAVLEKISCPTLIIHSVKDTIFNMSDAELLHRSIKGSTLQLLENAGHMSMMEQPDKVTEWMLGWMK